MWGKVKYKDDYSQPNGEDYISLFDIQYGIDPMDIDYEEYEEPIDYPYYLEFEDDHIKEIIEKGEAKK